MPPSVGVVQGDGKILLNQLDVRSGLAAVTGSVSYATASGAGEGKVRGYRYWSVAGKAIPGKDKGEAEHEAPPVNLKGLKP